MADNTGFTKADIGVMFEEALSIFAIPQGKLKLVQTT